MLAVWMAPTSWLEEDAPGQSGSEPGRPAVRRSPEALVGLQDVHQRPGGRSQNLVQREHGGEAAGSVMSRDAGVLDAEVLERMDHQNQNQNFHGSSFMY